MLGLFATWLLVICASNTEAFNANESVMRFDGSQLWRLSNIKDFELIQNLEENHGGDIWRDDKKSLDIAFMSKNLGMARQFLKGNNVSIKVLNSNIQELFDQERLRNSLTTFGALRSKWDSGINWKEYHDLDVIYDFLKDINKKYPNITTLHTIGKTVEGRKLKVLRISENLKNNKKIWIDGGIHAREWISPAAVTYIMDQFLSNWQNQPKHIKQLTWFFMPVVNPDGYDYSRKTYRQWRKNRAKVSAECYGVDINRNFDVFWSTASNHPCSTSYGGSAAGSELETKAIMKFLLKRKVNLKSFLTFHSYGQFILHPFAAKKKKIKNDAELQALERRVAKETGIRYSTGSVASAIKYGGLGGTSVDWSYVKLRAKYSLTMELRDTGDYGFLLPANQIVPTAKEALILVNAVAKAVNKPELH